MHRKNNPWLSLVAILLLALILVCTCTGCRAVTAEAAETKPAPANRYTYEIERHPGGPNFYTITDTDTGHQYLFVGGINKGGLCKLED